MKFVQFEFIPDWGWFYPIPTICFVKDEKVYYLRNFRISIHWLGWHASWVWLGERDE